ncbi:YjbH domain-containing protein [Thalassovita sp.]|uniref:YjbH domain-containing protein n=1 Tax=Thalassovita sp. TaxID=1979401 RepID=UPI0029DE7242|nr:YjbH domain-containing protein [Thalassovita sp.]
MKRRTAYNWCGITVSLLALFGASPAIPQQAGGFSGYAGYNTYGYPGLIDMPSGLSRPDGELSFSSSHFQNQTRNTLTFQISPRLSGSFRYALLYDVSPNVGGPVSDYRFDRSFSVHYRLLDEDQRRPAVAIGLNDFLGTGMYSSEYVVATKTIAPNLRITGGIGWGRLAGIGSFKNPLSILSDSFDTRPGRGSDNGGIVRTNNWFRGDAALFGGVEWQATDKLRLLAEYSSDAYPNEDGTAFDRKSPLNFGLSYAYRPHVVFGLNYLYGSEIGATVTVGLNPLNPPAGAGQDKAPVPVVPRADLAKLGWTPDMLNPNIQAGRLHSALQSEGIRLHGIEVGHRSVTLEIENERYATMPQAVGRTARHLTGLMPPEVDSFVIIPVSAGMRGAAISLRRADMERLEFDADAAWRSYARAQFETVQDGLSPLTGRYPHFDWGFKPYFTPSFFDPDDPVRVDFGLELAAKYEPAPGLVFRGTLRKKLFGNLDESDRTSTSVLPHVRSDFNIYERDGDPALTELTGAYYFKPGKDLYGRVTAGYLEPMYGGLSTELLWKPNNGNFALGLEVNYVKQRDFDQMLGFQDYEVATGHVSAYWDLGRGYYTQVDAGRYLAGDWGATFALDREFRNGWKVGFFATFTDVSFDDFGEGSFDKGLKVTIPLNWVSGQPSTQQYSTVIRPVTRDGGARLNVAGRLYEQTRGLQQSDLRDGWGRFWK